MKVLIADDEPSILLSLEFLMNKAGYEVFIARDGNEALEIIEEHQPGIIVLDIMMPGMDGYEVCRFVKHTHWGQTGTKIIFLSARGSKEDIEYGLKQGADLYMTKPFSTRDLMGRIRELSAPVK